MTENWRQSISAYRKKIGDRLLMVGAIAGTGAAIAIGVMEWMSAEFEYPLAVIPFATSIALVIGSPELPAAQPRALIGGHVISTLVGLVLVKIIGPQPWVAAVAVGLAVLMMMLTDTFHPPAGIDPLLVVSANLPWQFLLSPVLVGAVVLTAFAFVWHRWLWHRHWPERWF
ncbi:MAG: HPP family protein [Afipia sp.]|nr:HPP family protein [Afipia sp.]